MNTTILERWIRQYRSETVADFQQITHGHANDSFFVACQSGAQYVVRKLRNQAIESVEADARIQRILRKNGIGSPVYLRLESGSVIGRDNGDHFTIAKYIKGEAPANVSLQLIHNFGQVMAKMHRILDPDKVRLTPNLGQWLSLGNVAAEIIRCSSPKQAKLQYMLDTAKPVLEQDLPKAIIHGDFAMHNVFAKDNQVSMVFDFETADYAPRIIDIAETCLFIAVETPIGLTQIIGELVRGYNSVAERPIDKAELVSFDLAFQYVAAATASWCYNRDIVDFANRVIRISTEEKWL